MTQGIPKPSMGVLNPREGEAKFRLTRHAPSSDVGYFVKHYWVVNWDLRDQEPYSQGVVPNPCVNLVLEKGRSAIFAPARQKFSYLLKGKGRVFGVKFKPGGFYPFLQQPVSRLADQPLDVGAVFDVDKAAWEDDILVHADEEHMVKLADSFIRRMLPTPDPTVTHINEIIDRIAGDRDITKVDHICERFPLSKRSLQRLFDQYVGVSPKWVIQLYRIQNAAEKIDHAQIADWVKLSTDLGYHDQSHFIKDFKAIIGMTPGEYVRGRQTAGST